MKTDQNLTNYSQLVDKKQITKNIKSSDLLRVGVRDERKPRMYTPAVIEFSDLVSEIKKLTATLSAAPLKEYYGMFIYSSGNYQAFTIQDGLVGGKKHYANIANDTTVRYNLVDTQWEYAVSGIVDAYIDSILDFPQSGLWTLTGGGTIAVSGHIYRDDLQTTIENLSMMDIQLSQQLPSEDLISLLDTDLLNIGTPLTVMSAPPAGMYYEVVSVRYEYKVGSATFAITPQSVLALAYASSSNYIAVIGQELINSALDGIGFAAMNPNANVVDIGGGEYVTIPKGTIAPVGQAIELKGLTNVGVGNSPTLGVGGVLNMYVKYFTRTLI